MTPYSCVYGMEVILLAEIEAESLRIILESQILEAKWVKARYEQLILTDEKRLKALYHIQGYQRRMAQDFNKKVKPRNLKEGDLDLKEVRAPVFNPRPYVIKTLFSSGATKLMDMDGEEQLQPVNLDRLLKYYV